MNGKHPNYLPYGQHCVDDDDVAAVNEVLRSGTLTNGPVVQRFETGLANETKAREAVACSSGTAALHLAMAGLDIKPGDAVIVPTLTFLASANCVRYAGADVVFADVNPSTGLMEPAHLEAALKRAKGGTAKAAIAVHLNGQSCDMAALKKIADARNVHLVEDACHAIGGVAPDGAPVGACAHSAAACFSFHPVKAIAMGEGGAVTTNDPEIAARMRLLRSHGMERELTSPSSPDLALAPDGTANPWYYEMREVGWNYRASDIHCALALSQLGKLRSFVRRRGEIVARYDAALADLAPLVKPVRRAGGQAAWHLYVVRIDFEGLGKSRADVMRQLHDAGIGTQVHYLPVHLQPYYTQLYGRQSLPGADAYYSSCLSLPLFPAMSDADVDRVVTGLTHAVSR